MKTLELKGIDGKPLPKRWYNTLEKLIRAGKVKREYAALGQIRTLTNPFTNKSVQMGEIAHDICVWITSTSPTRNGLIRGDWDRARYIVNACWPDVYYSLID